MQTLTDPINQEFTKLIEQAYRVSREMGESVEKELGQASTEALTQEQAYSILSKTIEKIQRSAFAEGDSAVMQSLAGPVSSLVTRMLESQRELVAPVAESDSAELILELVEYNGIQPRPVLPAPVFHGVEVPVMEGYVRTSDINLWNENERLEIHLAQFRKQYGRSPSSGELLSIMLSRLNLPGTPDSNQGDEFAIRSLARSIATNGVRVRPILDIDGNPLDGNRRLAACNFILNSEEFTLDQKRAVEYIKVWQLTRHAMQHHRDAVVVSLNFEEDHKKPWPTYIKARKVYGEYQTRLRLEPNANNRRVSEIRKDLSQKFAIERRDVDRYITMVAWADDFEEHQVVERERDEFEVKHRANEAFEYFDELSKGKAAGGVAFMLGQNLDIKHLAFDLLFQGKFKNWKQIRALKHVPANEDAIRLLQRARDENDDDMAEELVDNALGIATAAHAQTREMGVNTRIQAFVKFMIELPLGTLTSDTLVEPTNLFKLMAVLGLAEAQVRAVYASAFDDRVAEAAKSLR